MPTQCRPNAERARREQEILNRGQDRMAEIAAPHTKGEHHHRRLAHLVRALGPGQGRLCGFWDVFDGLPARAIAPLGPPGLVVKLPEGANPREIANQQEQRRLKVAPVKCLLA